MYIAPSSLESPGVHKRRVRCTFNVLVYNLNTEYVKGLTINRLVQYNIWCAALSSFLLYMHVVIMLTENCVWLILLPAKSMV